MVNGLPLVLPNEGLRTVSRDDRSGREQAEG